MKKIYTVAVDDETAEFLTRGLSVASGGQVVAVRREGGEVELTDIEYFRALGFDDDASLTEDSEHGLQMWIGGDPYPVTVTPNEPS